MTKRLETIHLIGWREWLHLPELGIKKIKAKIDTGARTSSLHAYDIEKFRRGKQLWVRFGVHPRQRDHHTAIQAEAKVIDHRRIKNSGGVVTLRPVILTTVSSGPWQWQIELTLIGRDEMGFRMLLGRQAVRNRFCIDPGSSYLLGSP